MPGNVSNAAPATVLPLSLSKAFSHSREYAVIENEYKNGESQRSLLVSTSRKSWRMSKRLNPSVLATLRAFYDARKGSQQPFYYYDPADSGFTHDPTGVQTLGRYTVRFDGNWEQNVGKGRADVDLTLVELA